MKLLAIAGFVSLFPLIGFGQRHEALNAPPYNVTLLANSEIKGGGTLKLRGHVQVSSDSITIYADEADYNPLTGDVEARGHVHISLKKATPSIKISERKPRRCARPMRLTRRDYKRKEVQNGK